MSESAVWHIHTDGAARGNPGPAAYAFVIERNGLPAIEEKGCLGSSTNNLAEYTALVKALERATQLQARHLTISSDSELLVKQMNGVYRVKNEDLRTLYDRARQLCRGFEHVLIRHVRREQNSHADRLCNEALDLGCPPPPDTAPVETPAPPLVRGAPKPGPAPREAALACLREAAARWARGNPADPNPEAILDQLTALLANDR